MGNLRHAVADKEQVKRTEDYADADTAKQNAYNSAVSSAETIINDQQILIRLLMMLIVQL
ncbi:FIVAR domain-containing protein [Staphylococcus aureus]